MSRKRQSFNDELKKEIAHGYVTKALSSKEIEARGIRMGNVHRWVAQFFGPGGKKAAANAAKEPHIRLLERKGTTSTTPATATPAAATAPLDIRALTKRQLKRGANGRYDKVVKDAVTAALATMSVGEASEITGINEATLYLWKGPAKPAASSSPGTALIPVNGVEPINNKGHALIRKAEVLINPESTEALLTGIRKSEGFANLDKAVKQLKAAHRAGVIDDYDEIDLRMLLGYRQLTGGGLRSRK